jgi:hypothetical protein
MWQCQSRLDVHKWKAASLAASNSRLNEWRHEENNRTVANGQYIIVRALNLIVYGDWSIAMVRINVFIGLFGRNDWDAVPDGW